MSESPVHYELFVRRRPAMVWTLELATEDRERAVETAQAMVADGRAAAVRVSREMLDADSGEFRAATVLSLGEVDGPAPPRPAPREASSAPALSCAVPADLYAPAARALIGRLLEGWLARRRLTAFELLHRPDLAQALDASGTELQHAVQKFAVPEAKARGLGVHTVIRAAQRLSEAAIARLAHDGRLGMFPDLAVEPFADAARRLAGRPDAAYALGGAVAARLADAEGWGGKLARLLDLADAAPGEGEAGALAFAVLAEPLGEMLAARVPRGEALGLGGDLGAQLADLTRLVSGAPSPPVDLVAARFGSPAAALGRRLSAWLARAPFEAVRIALARHVIDELRGPRRLRPGDAEGEIAVLRALAALLSAVPARVLDPEVVHDAFAERSQALVSADFIEAYLAPYDTALGQAQALLRLAENLVGAGARRTAGRWLSACVGAPRFEKEARFGPDSPAAKLQALADLQRAAFRAGMADADLAALNSRVGEAGALVEADARLSQAIARASGPLTQRLALLLRMAVGEAAPLGPAANRARAEALRLLRAPETRSELAEAAPAALAQVRRLMQAGGLAA